MEWKLVLDDVEAVSKQITETKPVTIVIDETRICLGKHQGIFYAIEDTCPHQDASLGKGKTLPTGGVQCPFHHYVIDIKTGECMVGGCRDLKTNDVKYENNKLYLLA